jgi:hypothetical protein
MVTLASILNLVQCGLGAVLGTGMKGCKPFFKKATAMWLTPQGFKYEGDAVDGNLDEEYIKLLQAQGNLIVVKGIRTFTDNSTDDIMETLEDQTKSVASLGLYEFALQFINGLYYHAALHSLNTFGAYDATFIDRDGNILGTKSSDGFLKGFTVGYLQAMKLSFATDTTSQKEGLGLQLLERAELDSDYVYIQRNQLDFDPNKIEGINEIELTFAATPTALDANITVKAVRKQDKGIFTGADFNDFSMTRDGVTDNPTAGDDSGEAGTYILTVPPIIRENADDIINLVKLSQLGLGLDSQGDLMGIYAESTQQFADNDPDYTRKKRKTAGQPYNFEWTEGVFKGMDLKFIQKDQYEIFTKDGKQALLESIYGVIVDLTEEHNDFVNDVILFPGLINFVVKNVANI